MRKLLPLLVFILVTSLAGCASYKEWNNATAEKINNLDIVYKINVLQGNVLKQETVDQLRPGMDKRQVRFLLGTPLIQDAFHENRWDYYYSLSLAGKEPETERVSLIFQDDRLVSLTGTFKPSNEIKPRLVNTQVIDIPPREEKEKTMIERFLHSVGIEYEEKI